MKISILTSHHFITSQWSGGSSTQLYIYPPEATYAERNFELRISTAKVEIESSTFTILPGVQRKLMILEGEIKIHHEGRYHKHLKPFDVDNFSGDWKSTSKGICTDFNVMTTSREQSELYYLAMGPISEYQLKPHETCKSLFLYAHSGTIQLQFMNENYLLETGNLLVIENLNLPSLSITSAKDFGIVVVEIN